MTHSPDLQEIINELKVARERSCVPLVAFTVSAVIKTKDGHFFTGVNTQTADMSLSECAERSAIFAMVSAVGARHITDVWVMGGPQEMTSGDFSVTPCGGCRQVLACFVTPDATFHQVTLDGEIEKSTPFWDLLPQGFGFKDVGLEVDYKSDESNVAPAHFRGLKS